MTVEEMIQKAAMEVLDKGLSIDREFVQETLKRLTVDQREDTLPLTDEQIVSYTSEELKARQPTAEELEAFKQIALKQQKGDGRSHNMVSLRC